jgi:hypothetical protein
VIAFRAHWIIRPIFTCICKFPFLIQVNMKGFHGINPDVLVSMPNPLSNYSINVHWIFLSLFFSFSPSLPLGQKSLPFPKCIYCQLFWTSEVVTPTHLFLVLSHRRDLSPSPCRGMTQPKMDRSQVGRSCFYREHSWSLLIVFRLSWSLCLMGSMDIPCQK